MSPRSSDLPRISARNVLRLGENVLGYLAARLPASLDITLIARLIESQVDYAPLRRTIEARMRWFFDVAGMDSDPELTAAEYIRTYRELQWIRCRALADQELPFLYTEVEGKERIYDALEQRHGALLWGMHFCGFLAAKIALHREGVQLVHLSTASHGAGAPLTRFGLRTLARMYRRPEDHFLSERVVIPQHGSLRYLRLLKQRLEENRCLWILGEAVARHGNIRAPFFSWLRYFATGAPALAWRTRATLLPTLTVRVGRYHYRVIVGEPLQANANNKHDFVQSMVLQFARRLEECVKEYPFYWNWHRDMRSMLMLNTTPRAR